MERLRRSRIAALLFSVALAAALAPGVSWADDAENHLGQGAWQGEAADSAEEALVTQDAAEGAEALEEALGTLEFAAGQQEEDNAHASQEAAGRISVFSATPLAAGAWSVDGAAFDTLKEAVDSVAANGTATITLTADTDETTLLTIGSSKNITLDLGGNTVSVSLGDTSKTFITTSSGTTLTVKNGTLQGSADGRAFDVSGELVTQDLVVDKFASSFDGGALYLRGKATCTNTTFSNNRSDKKAVDRYGGGAIYLPQSPAASPYELNLSSCTFDKNFAAGNGGAICIDWSGNATIKGCEFTENVTYVSGGAVYANFPKDLLFEGNTFDGNSATYAYEKYQDYWDSGYNDTLTDPKKPSTQWTRIGYGGALRLNCLNHPMYTSYGIGPSNVTLRDNTIANNTADRRGGGISLVNNQFGAKTSCISIESGLFEGNEAPIGGAIDYTQHNQATLQLNDTLITGNNAVRGGGIWLCPQGSIDEYSTLGGTVVGNFANGQMSTWSVDPAGVILANGDDINHEGSDSKDVAQVESEPANGAKVSDRGLGGIGINWYEDEADYDEGGNHVIERYREGHEVLVFPAAAAGEYPDLVNGTDLSFGIHAELAGSSLAQQEQYAKIIIRNNTALRGGGIASNSPIAMGVDEPTRTVTVSKTWNAGEVKDAEIPAKLLVDLYRIDNGDADNPVKLDSDVELTAAGGWKHEFTDLPAYGLNAAGERVEYTYTVKEQAVSGWEEDAEAREEQTEGLATVVGITNVPAEPEPEPTKPVDVVLVKHLVDALIHAEEFSFGLYDESGTLLDTVHTTLGTHTAPSTDEYSSYVEIAFKDLVFEKAGTYNYTIREHMDGTTEVVAGDENNLKGFEPGFYRGGVKYDDRVYSVQIAVDDADGDGKLEAVVTYPGSSDGDAAELTNEYSEEYTEIDGQDSHRDDGKHEETTTSEKPKTPEQEETPGTKPDTPKATTPATPAATPKGTAKTADAAPVAGLVAMLALGGVGLAASRRRRSE